VKYLDLTGKAIGATIDGMRGEVVNHMAKKGILDKLSIYIPQKKMKLKPGRVLSAIVPRTFERKF